jgi:hypothetical protein
LSRSTCPVRHAFRDREVEHAAVGMVTRFLAPWPGLEKIDLQGVAYVAAARGEWAAGLPAPAPEEIGKDVAEAELFLGAGRAAERPGAAACVRW